MAETSEPQDRPGKARRWLAPAIAVMLAIILAGGGFYATFTGLVFGHGQARPPTAEEQANPLPQITFVPIEPIVIPLGAAGAGQHLRLVADLEIANAHVAEATLLLPRIRDVMNSYLRAVDVGSLQDPASLIRIRAQMLRRIQTVTGEGRVQDLLISEFMLN